MGANQIIFAVNVGPTINAGTETVIANFNGIALNQLNLGSAGLVFLGTVNGATQATTTSVRFRLRRGTDTTGFVCDDRTHSVSNLNGTQVAMPNWSQVSMMADLNPPLNASVTSGGGALPASLQVGVNGVPVVDSPYVVTLTPTGGTFVVNGAFYVVNPVQVDL